MSPGGVPLAQASWTSVLAPAMALGGAGGLDRTAFGQTLLSHPAILATLTGWLLGVPAEGAWLGLALTVFAAADVPVGPERLRDWSSAAVAACCAAARVDAPWAWGCGLLTALIVAVLGGRAIGAVRRGFERIVARAQSRLEPDAFQQLERVQLACAGIELMRGAFVTTLATWGIGALLASLDRPARGALQGVLGSLWTVAPLLALPLALRLHLRGQRPVWVGAGLLGGAGLWWMTQGSGR